MNKKGTISLNGVLSFFIKIFIFVNLFFPYVNRIDSKNVTFILSNFISSFIILILVFKNRKNKKNKIFLFFLLIMIFIYNILAGKNNYLYNNYFIEQINKTISFIFFMALIYKIDDDFIKKYKIIEFLIYSIVTSVFFSFLFYLIGGDALRFENGGFSIRGDGVYSDRRLTWIFGHKSTYGIMLLLFIALVLKNKSIFKRKKNFYLSLGLLIFTTIITGSATTLILLVFVLSAYCISVYDFKRVNMLILALIPLGLLTFSIIALLVLDKVGETRNLATLGSRSYIFKAAINNLKLYPNGIGKEFGSIWMDAVVIRIENFHNIFLNEMLRFSIPVGVMYTLILIYINIYCCLKKNIFYISVVLSTLILCSIDHSLRTEQLSIYFFIIYIIYMTKEKK